MAIFFIIILLLVILNGNSANNLKDFLYELDLETVKPLLSIFGINESLLDAVNNENLRELLSGDVDILSLVKTIIPLISAVYSTVNGVNTKHQKVFSSEANTETLPDDLGNDKFTKNEHFYDMQSGGLNPVKDLLSADNLADLEDYFNC